MHQTLVGIGTSMIISVILVYLLMVALYNSYLSPFIIIFSVPVAAIGAIGALVLTHRTLNLFSLIGTILLIGIATKNGILLVDYANTLARSRERQARRDHGERAHPVPADRHDELLGRRRQHAARARARSGIELALEPRHRGHRRRLSSLVLTLLLIPNVYMWVAPSDERFRREFHLAQQKNNGKTGAAELTPAH